MMGSNLDCFGATPYCFRKQLKEILFFTTLRADLQIYCTWISA